MGKKSAPPPAPDYSALAIQQAELAKKAAEEQNKVNRPSQNTPWGSTSWVQTPDGQWTQNTILNEKDQALLDQERIFQGQQQEIGAGALNQASATMGKSIDYSAAPQITGYDTSQLPQVDPNTLTANQGPQGQIDASKLSGYGMLNTSNLTQLDPGFGAVEGVRDAMMGRLAPARQQAREGEIQRLKNQGLTEDSPAFQRAVMRLDQADTDAQQQALLAATGEYGNIFNRGLASNNQTFQQQLAGAGFANQTRAQQLAEQGIQADLANTNRDTAFNQNAQVQQMLASLRGQQFNEQGQMAQLSGQQRQQNLAEQEAARQAPLNDYMKLVQGVNPSMPVMPAFMPGAGYQAPDMLGAAQMTYQAQMDAANAAKAKKGGLMGGIGTVAGGVLGAMYGGPAGAAVGASAGGALGGALGGG